MSLLRSVSLIEVEASAFCDDLRSVVECFKLFSQSLCIAHEDKVRETQSLSQERDGMSSGQAEALIGDLLQAEQVALSGMTLALLVVRLEEFLNRCRSKPKRETLGVRRKSRGLINKSLKNRNGTFCKLEKEYLEGKPSIDFTELQGYETCLEVVLARHDFIHNSISSRQKYKEKTAQRFLKHIEPEYSESQEVLLLNQDSLLMAVGELGRFARSFSLQKDSCHIGRWSSNASD